MTPDAGWQPWQQAYRHGTLVIRPPAELRDMVDALRRRYDPESARISEAHITLTQPLVEALSDADARQIAARCEQEAPFEIRVGPLRSFLPAPVLWLDTQPAARIVALRGDLHALDLFDLGLPHTDDFVPHMTVTEGLSGPAVDKALMAAIEPVAPAGTFRCEGITLLVPDAEFRFRPVREFRFGASTRL